MPLVAPIARTPWPEAELAAVCRYSAHPAPASVCGCGVAVMTTLEALVSWQLGVDSPPGR